MREAGGQEKNQRQTKKGGGKNNFFKEKREGNGKLKNKGRKGTLQPLLGLSASGYLSGPFGWVDISSISLLVCLYL